MKYETKRALGFTLSIMGLIVIVWHFLSYITPITRPTQAVLIIGLIFAAIGIWINNQVLFGKKK